MRRLPLALLSVALNCALAWAVPVPINGDFERAEQFSAAGWDADGQWSFKGHQGYEGRRSAATGPRVLSGDRLISNSGMVLRGREAVILRGYYRGSGIGVGIEVVGLLGEPLVKAETSELQPADDWTEFSITYQPPEDFQADEFAYARAYCEALSDDAQGVFDNLRFEDHEIPLPPRPKPEEDDEDKKPEEIPIPPPPANLVPNPGFIGGYSPRGWFGFGADEQLGWRSGTRPALSLMGGQAAAGWSAELERMDISVPHVLSLDCACAAEGAQAGAEVARVVLLVLAPDRPKVYHHQILPLRPDQERLTALVPAVQKLPASGYGRLTVLVPGGFESELSFSRPSLVADPHLPAVSARQKFKIFSEAEKVSLFIRVPNQIDQITEMVTHLKFVNRAGVALSYEKRQMAVGPRAVALFPAGARLKYNGAYKLIVRAEATDGSRSFAYGEYPFVVSPATPQDAKSPQFGVALDGSSAEQVLAAASAGAGWVAVPLQYSRDPGSHRFRARLRQLRELAEQAASSGVQFAVQLRFGADDVLSAADFTGFFEAVNAALGSYADAYVLGVPPKLLAAADSYAQMGAIADLIRRLQEARPGKVASLIMAPVGSVAGIKAARAEADKLLPDAGTDRAEPGLWPAAETEPTGETETVSSPAEAGENPTQAELESAYEALYVPDSAEVGNWLLPLAPAAGDQRRTEIAADALMVRQALEALGGEYDVAFWQDAGETAMLDATGAATECWAALWNMCVQVGGKEFIGGEVTEGVRCVRFAGEYRDTVVAWAERGSRSVMLSGDLYGASKVDIGGAEWPLSSPAGRAKVTLSTDPLYLSVRHGGQLSLEPD